MPAVSAPADPWRDFDKKSAWIFSGRVDVDALLDRGGFFLSSEFKDAYSAIRQRMIDVLGEDLTIEPERAGDPMPAEKGPKDNLKFGQGVAKTFAFQMAYGAVLNSHGFRPAATVGICQGEITAAHFAGAIPEAAAIDCLRRLFRTVIQPTTGRRLWIVQGHQTDLDLSSISMGKLHTIFEINAHKSLCWAEEGADADDIASCFAGTNLSAGPAVRLIYHHNGEEEFRRELGHYRGWRYPKNERERPLYSSLLGGRIERADCLDQEFWSVLASRPVRFASAVTQMRAEGVGAFLHIGHLSDTELQTDPETPSVALPRV